MVWWRATRFLNRLLNSILNLKKKFPKQQTSRRWRQSVEGAIFKKLRLLYNCSNYQGTTQFTGDSLFLADGKEALPLNPWRAMQISNRPWNSRADLHLCGTFGGIVGVWPSSLHCFVDLEKGYSRVPQSHQSGVLRKFIGLRTWFYSWVMGRWRVSGLEQHQQQCGHWNRFWFISPSTL